MRPRFVFGYVQGFLLRVTQHGYLLQPKVSPPQQTSKARMRIRQQGFTLKLKFFIFPPQQQRKRIINKIHVQLQPPFSQPPQPSSLNIPLNIFRTSVFRIQFGFVFDFCKVYFTIWILQKLCYSYPLSVKLFKVGQLV